MGSVCGLHFAEEAVDYVESTTEEITTVDEESVIARPNIEEIMKTHAVHPPNTVKVLPGPWQWHRYPTLRKNR